MTMKNSSYTLEVKQQTFTGRFNKTDLRKMLYAARLLVIIITSKEKWPSKVDRNKTCSVGPSMSIEKGFRCCEFFKVL